MWDWIISNKDKAWVMINRIGLWVNTRPAQGLLLALCVYEKEIKLFPMTKYMHWCFKILYCLPCYITIYYHFWLLYLFFPALGSMKLITSYIYNYNFVNLLFLLFSWETLHIGCKRERCKSVASICSLHGISVF